MQSRFLNLAAAAVSLAIAAPFISPLLLSSSDAPASAAQASLPVESVLRDGRVYLTPAQVRQTRDARQWSEEVHSLLNIDHPLRHGEWRWNDRGVPPGRSTIRVDLERQLISVVRNGHEIGSAVILYGADTHDTPLGRFSILSRAADYRSRKYDAPMPYALRLTEDGVALHGSNVRFGVATHGCIGLPIAFARRLFEQANVGDKVLIVRAKLPKDA